VIECHGEILKLVKPAPKDRTVATPVRRLELRTREHLTYSKSRSDSRPLCSQISLACAQQAGDEKAWRLHECGGDERDGGDLDEHDDCLLAVDQAT